jgi:DNA modification methylase
VAEPALIRGDARTLPLADESVDLIVTSPPYFGLRSYQDGGEHYAGQIGAEASPREFVDALIGCTREMVRVLKPTGSIFVNLGDKYAGHSTGCPDTSTRRGPQTARPAPEAFPHKSLMLIPERYRLAAVDELGLVARAVIVWSKPNGLPESVKDRVRRSHEDWVHLTKRPQYFAAVDGIREKAVTAGTSWQARKDAGEPGRNRGGSNGNAAGVHTKPITTLPSLAPNPLGKLPGSVWEVPTQPLRAPAELGVDHFAAFPMEWPRRFITGWCPPDGVVLDPFGGTGTTALVASMLGRRGISLDLSADYARLAAWRCNDPKERARAAGTDPAKAVVIPPEQPDLFGGAA